MHGFSNVRKHARMHIKPRLIAREILHFEPAYRFLECISDEEG
ncbi:hypothetical protein [Pseudomonas sp. 8(2025)]